MTPRHITSMILTLAALASQPAHSASTVSLETQCKTEGHETGILLAIATTFASKAIDYGVGALSAALKKKATDAVDIRTASSSDVLGAVKAEGGITHLSVEKTCLVFVSGKAKNKVDLPPYFGASEAPDAYYAAELDFLSVGENRVAFRIKPVLLGLAPSGNAKEKKGRDVVATVKLQLPAAAVAANVDKDFEIVMPVVSVPITTTLSKEAGKPSKWFSLPALALGKTPISFEVTLSITATGSGNPLYLHLAAAIDEHKTKLRDEILVAAGIKDTAQESQD